MANIICIHEYVLKPAIDADQFEKAFCHAQEQGLFDLPGLSTYHVLKGIKGSRTGHYTAIWVYESREAWEALWGTVEHPRQKHEYPTKWQVWEDDILAPLLTQEPDTITFTSYEAVMLASG